MISFKNTTLTLMTESNRCLSKKKVLNLLKMNPNDPRMRAFCSRHVIIDSEEDSEWLPEDSEWLPEDGYESDFNEEWKWEWITEDSDEDTYREYDPKWF